MQVHLIELPKSRAVIDNIADISPLERWAFLFRNAHCVDVLQKLLRIEQSPPETLAQLSIDALTVRIVELEKQLNSRGDGL